ncbi:MAG TPA: ATP-binding protein [Thermoanaerobaculia bacterium]|nr:ATP-binding protein [Thermoanaerobaculia bacterium]
MPSLFPEPDPPCPICKGFGVLEAKDGRRLVPCRCREVDRLEERRRAARIPERYRNCRLANFNVLPAQNASESTIESQRRARALARRFVDEYPVDQGILIAGPVGMGKTHLAVAILLELLETKGVDGVFCDFTDLLERIQATYGKGVDESADEVLAPYRDAPLLVLDELGARRPTDWARDVLYGLLNTRYNRKRITILTTNFVDVPSRTGDETLEARIGTTVRSRLYEMCKLLEISGDDYRRIQKKSIFV